MSALTDFLDRGVLGKRTGSVQEENQNIRNARRDQQQARNLQHSFAGQLRDQMAGKGPSLATEQLTQGVGAAQRAGMATAASARGGNAALAGRTAAQQASGASMQAAGQAAQIRAGEQLSAQQQYGGLLQASRQQDLMGQQAEQQQLATWLKTHGEDSERAQKSAGGMIAGLGSLVGLSDIGGKQDVQPAGLTPEQGEAAAVQRFQASMAPVYQQALRDQQGSAEKQQEVLKAQQDEMAKQQADFEQRNAAAPKQGGGLGDALGGALGAWGGTLASDERSKERIAELETLLRARRSDVPTARYADEDDDTSALLDAIKEDRLRQYDQLESESRGPFLNGRPLSQRGREMLALRDAMRLSPEQEESHRVEQHMRGLQPHLEAVRGAAPDEPFTAPDVSPEEMDRYYGSSLSDENSKQQLRQLRAENAALSGALRDTGANPREAAVASVKRQKQSRIDEEYNRPGARRPEIQKMHDELTDEIAQQQKVHYRNLRESGARADAERYATEIQKENLGRHKQGLDLARAVSASRAAAEEREMRRKQAARVYDPEDVGAYGALTAPAGFLAGKLARRYAR